MLQASRGAAARAVNPFYDDVPAALHQQGGVCVLRREII
jgi:hypothetical protein